MHKRRFPVALKILDPDKFNFCRAEREIDSMRRCDSPFIGNLYEWGIHRCGDGSQYLFIVEEYFDGGTLSDKLNGTTIGASIVCDYGLVFIQALAHLRELDLVHRDIKPENVMFRSGEDVPVLVDFGIVRDLRDISLTMSYLERGPGTPFFASPEQLNNEKQLIDWRSDQFSVGVVLGLSLVGVHPYGIPNDRDADTVDRVAMRKGISNDFQKKAEALGCGFLMRMAAAWPIDRYGHPDDIATAIDQAKREM